MLVRVSPRPTAESSRGIASPAGPADPASLRIVILVYRGNPRCGGQGVYTRHLSSALTRLGHRVEVVSGPPYPRLDPGVRLTRLPSLDLYRADDPFRIPHRWEFRDAIDVAEFAVMCTAGFPEPLTFSLRALRELRPRLRHVDVLHDNQSLGYGLLPLLRGGVPTVATIHHPITVDRRLDLAAAVGVRRRVTLQRWYGFTRMQRRVARTMPRVLTVSASSRRDLVSELGIDPSRVHLVPLGVDSGRFRPLPGRARVRGRILTTASADVTLKGLVHLVEALALVRRRHPDAHLVVVGRPKERGAAEAAVSRLGLSDVIHFQDGVSDEGLNELYASAEVAAVPSLYEGFSLPAVECMAAGCALVASDAGAIPEVAGRDASAALLALPGDPASLAAAIGAVLDDCDLRDRLGRGGRERTLRLFSWPVCAAATVEHYRAAIDAAPRGARAC